MRNFRGFLYCGLLLVSTVETVHSQGPMLQSPSREIKISAVKIEGNRTVDASLILKTIQLEKDESYLPQVLRNKIQGSVTALDKLKLFSDIRVEQEEADSADGLTLIFIVDELPTLAKVEYKGQNKLKTDDFKEKVDLLDGQVYSVGAVETARQNILALYHEKGYLLAEVRSEEKEEKSTGRKIVTFRIKEGKKVAVRYVTFDGNANVADKALRKRFPIKEDRWWRSGDYKEDEARLGLDSLIEYYKELGYLDASVQSDTVLYATDKKHLDIRVKVHEGKRYRFAKAKFIHNAIVKDEALRAQVIFDSGEVFDKKKYDLMKYQITSLYREEGYLFVDMGDRFEYHDTLVEVTFQIKENSLAHINLVDIRGNTKTKDKVVRREIKLFPGDVYRQSLMMRSQRDVMQLAFFDNVMPDIKPVPEGDGSEVDLIFQIQEKEAGTGTFSAGAAYSGRDKLVFTTGVQIPNFLGNGQRAELNLEIGPYKKLGSLGFTEPWFLDAPTLVGGRLFYSEQIAQNSYYTDSRRYGVGLNLGRRLRWPDDYFTIRGGYNFTYNDNGYGSDRDYLILASGLESSVNLTLVRDDKNLPFFPSDGSKYSLTVNRVGGYLGGDFDYTQYEAKVNWWFPTLHKLVLGVETEFGVILGDNIHSYALYQMGGMLGLQGKLRGYDAGSIASGRVARSFFSFVTELTYPVVENTFYTLAFFDAGNAFGRLLKYDQSSGVTRSYSSIPKHEAPDPWDEIDFSNLRRDFGFGFRVVVPMVAPFGMGFDFGWPLDDGELSNGQNDPTRGMKVQFTIEQGL